MGTLNRRQSTRWGRHAEWTNDKCTWRIKTNDDQALAAWHCARWRWIVSGQGESPDDNHFLHVLSLPPPFLPSFPSPPVCFSPFLPYWPFSHFLSSLNPPRVSIEPPSVRPPNAHVLIRYTLKLNSIFKGMNSEEHCRRRIHQTSWMCFSVLVSCISKPAKFTPFCITMHSRPTETLKTDGKGKGKFVL